MGLADKIKTTDTTRKPPGPKPQMIRLLDTLSEEDRKALEALISNESITAPTISEILAEESADLKAAAEKAKDEDEKARLEELADLHDLSAFTIGRFRRQIKAGRPGVY